MAQRNEWVFVKSSPFTLCAVDGRVLSIHKFISTPSIARPSFRYFEKKTAIDRFRWEGYKLIKMKVLQNDQNESVTHFLPILLLVCFHNAMRADLDDLRRVTAASLDAEFSGRCCAFDLEVLRRFEFLKLAYKYHCSAQSTEDEVRVRLKKMDPDAWSLLCNQVKIFNGN